MAAYTIQPLCFGYAIRKTESRYRKPEEEEPQSGPIISYYVQGEGHKIIVDTGGTPPDGVRWQPYFRTEDQEPEKALQNIGVSPEEIDIVILTHLHWDHSSNNHLFPNARFIVQKKEYEYLASPDTKDPDGSEPFRLALETEYELVDGDCEIVPGISVILTPGHTPGSQSVVVETAAGPYIMVGDLVLLFDHWEVLPRIPNALAEDQELIKKSIEKIEKLNGYVLPGHDWEVFRRKSIYP